MAEGGNRPLDESSASTQAALLAEENARLSRALNLAERERSINQLETALNSRSQNLIGQAQGLLMGRLEIDADQAFDFLERASMHSNRKIVHVAEEIVRSHELRNLG